MRSADNTVPKFELDQLRILVKDYCGLQFNGTDITKLQQAVQQRCEHIGLGEDKYLANIKTNQAELDELVNLLTINETYFFREQEQIALLVNNIIPELQQLKQNNNQPNRIKILSAGCSSGEEPYSIAISLSERYQQQTSARFEIIGADIDTVALAKAECGLYTEFSFRNLTLEQQQRYFQAEGKNYRIDPEIKKLVSLKRLNLFSETDIADFISSFDVIFFRNVSIYFDKNTRLRVLQSFKSMMAPHAVLIVGTAETLANDLGVFRLIKKNDLFYFVNGPVPEAKQLLVQEVARTDAKPVAANPLQAPQQWQAILTKSKQETLQKQMASDLELVRAKIAEQKYDESIDLLDQLLQQDSSLLEAQILKSYVLLQRNDLFTARDLAVAAHNQDAWLVDALMLLGLIERAANNYQQALAWFKKLIYLHQDCWLAHYYSASVYSELNTDQALRSYRIADGLLSRQAEQNYLCFLPRPVPIAAARLVCNHKLAGLGPDKLALG